MWILCISIIKINVTRYYMENYLRLVDSFFTLKKKYDKKYNDSVKKIRKQSISLTDKKKKISEIKRKCIQCGKDGGTMFKVNQESYEAVCNSRSEKCDLAFTIPRSIFYSGRSILSSLQGDLLDIERKIIELKLKQVFDYITDETLVEEFEEKSAEYQGLNQGLEKMREDLSKRFNDGDAVAKKREIQRSMKQLKELYTSYKNTQEERYLDDIVEMNLIIQKLEKEYNDLLYTERHMEFQRLDQEDTTVVSYHRGGDLIPQHELSYDAPEEV